MACPISHPSQLDVLNLINQQNNATLVAEDINILVPAVSTEHERNTVSRVEATPDSPYNSYVDIYYDRLDLKRMFHDAEEVEVIVGGEPDFQDIVCGLNATYGTTFDSEEFNGTAAVNDVVTMTAKAESRGYTGTLKIRLIHERVHLQDRLTSINLNGFLYPNADRPSLNNPVKKIDISDTWLHNGSTDNDLGYDQAENGELRLTMRTWIMRSGWQSPRDYRGVKYPVGGGPRQLTSWRETNGSTTQATGHGWDLAVQAPGKTILEIMEAYDVFFETRSRANATQPWTERLYQLRKDAVQPWSGYYPVGAGTAFGQTANLNMAAGSLFRWSVSLANAFPGLVVSNNKYIGFCEYRMYATRKAGRAKELTIEATSQSV